MQERYEMLLWLWSIMFLAMYLTLVSWYAPTQRQNWVQTLAVCVVAQLCWDLMVLRAIRILLSTARA